MHNNLSSQLNGEFSKVDQLLKVFIPLCGLSFSLLLNI